MATRDTSGGGKSGAARLSTVGHSTLALEDFVALLAAHGVEAVADVRRFPASRRHPHFARASLERELPRAGVEYLWLGGELGGRRSAGKGPTAHAALRNASFRAYAAHMETPPFREGLEQLLALAARQRTAVMCAERWWGSCHRSFIADALKGLRGVEVEHLLDAQRSEPHRLHRTARVEGNRIVYDRAEAPAEGQGSLFE